MHRADDTELNIISNYHVFKRNHIAVVTRTGAKCQICVLFTRLLIGVKGQTGARALGARRGIFQFELKTRKGGADRGRLNKSNCRKGTALRI